MKVAFNYQFQLSFAWPKTSRSNWHSDNNLFGGVLRKYIRDTEYSKSNYSAGKPEMWKLIASMFTLSMHWISYALNHWTKNPAIGEHTRLISACMWPLIGHHLFMRARTLSVYVNILVNNIYCRISSAHNYRLIGKSLPYTYTQIYAVNWCNHVHCGLHVWNFCEK